MNKKNIIILVVLAIIIVGAVVLSVSQKNQEVAIEQPDQSKQKSEVMVNEIDISNWQNYQNDEFGFEFKYPGRWGALTAEGDITKGANNVENQRFIFSNKSDVSKFRLALSINGIRMVESLLDGPENQLAELARIYHKEGSYECNVYFGKTAKLSQEIFVTLYGEGVPLDEIECDNAIELGNDGSRYWFGLGDGAIYMTRDELPERLYEVYDEHQAVMNSIKLK